MKVTNPKSLIFLFLIFTSTSYAVESKSLPLLIEEMEKVGAKFEKEKTCVYRPVQLRGSRAHYITRTIRDEESCPQTVQDEKEEGVQVFRFYGSMSTPKANGFELNCRYMLADRQEWDRPVYRTVNIANSQVRDCPRQIQDSLQENEKIVYEFDKEIGTKISTSFSQGKNGNKDCAIKFEFIRNNVKNEIRTYSIFENSSEQTTLISEINPELDCDNSVVARPAPGAFVCATTTVKRVGRVRIGSKPAHFMDFSPNFTLFPGFKNTNKDYTSIQKSEAGDFSISILKKIDGKKVTYTCVGLRPN